MKVLDLIKKEIAVKTVIKELNHEVNPFEIERLKTPKDVVFHVCCILSDVQEMLLANYPKEQINDEINEAKFFLFKLLEYFEKVPECELKDICIYYKRIKETYK